MIEKVQKLCEKVNEYGDGFDYSKEKLTLSMDIRITMQSLIRGIIFYGQHLNGFLKEPKPLPRLSYQEKQAEVEPTSTE